MESNVSKKFLTAHEAAELMRLNLNTVYCLARAGKLASIRVTPGKIVFSLDDLNDYMRSRRMKTDAEYIADAEKKSNQ